MSVVLIIDSGKSSLVMTSEAVKDTLPGATVIIARSGAEGLTYLENVKDFALIIIDFDLPDSDGVTLAKHIRLKHKTPILLTAFMEPIVEEAIKQEVSEHADISDVIPKPVRLDNLAKKIDTHLRASNYLEKRYLTSLGATVVKAETDNGGKAPIVKGSIFTLSQGGALMKTSEKIPLKKGDDLILNLDLGTANLTKYKKLLAESQKKVPNNQKRLTLEPKQLANIKTKVIWVDKNKQQIGLKFSQLNDMSREFFEGIMRNAKELE